MPISEEAAALPSHPAPASQGRNPSVRRAGCDAPSEQGAREASRATEEQVKVRRGCVRMRRADGNVFDSS